MQDWNIVVAPKATPDAYHKFDVISWPKAPTQRGRSGWPKALDVEPRLPRPQVRLDLHLELRRPERSLDVAPHGLIGQSFDGSDVGVDGAVDPQPQPGEHMTTKAMAEGSIEGVWQD